MIGAKPPAPASAPAKATAPGRRARRRPQRGRALLTLDTDSPASVVSCVGRARERGRTMRDVISTEMWEAMNAFYLGSLGRYDLQAALPTGPYSCLSGGQGALRAVLGAARPDDAARRGPRVPRGGRAHRGGRHGAAHAAGRAAAARGRWRGRRRPRGRGAGAAAGGRRLAGLPAGRAPRRRRCAASRASCCSREPTRTRWRPSVDALRAALRRGRRQPRAPRRRCCGWPADRRSGAPAARAGRRRRARSRCSAACRTS